MKTTTAPVLALVLLLAACGEDDGGNERELITTVQLTFTPASGTPVVAEYHDPDGDGGDPPVADPIVLAPGTTYTTTVKFENRLETPEEDITLEVRDEAIDHQVFFTGEVITGPATPFLDRPLVHAYADMDANGLPLGLTNTITTMNGSGPLIVTLRHMPPELPPGKSAETAADVAAGGFSAIGGSTDAQAMFDVSAR